MYTPPIDGLPPKVYFLITLICNAFGMVASIATSWEIPQGVIQIFQIIAFSGAGVSGLIAAIRFYEEKKPKLKRPKFKRKK